MAPRPHLEKCPSSLQEGSLPLPFFINRMGNSASEFLDTPGSGCQVMFSTLPASSLMISLSRLGPLGRVNDIRVPKQLSEHTYNRKTCFIDSWRRAVDTSPLLCQIPTSDGEAGESGEPTATGQNQGSGPLLFSVSGLAFDFVWKMCSRPLK